VLANAQRIADLARSFEIRGGLSFRGFVERLSLEAAKIGTTQGPVLEEGADGVRIMTAHAAKGLEFPVVILADITARLSPFEPSRTIDPENNLCAQKILQCSPWDLVDHFEVEELRDRAEGIRLAYVAATRARDLLVVPAVGDEPWESGWTSPLNRAIYPEKKRFREAVQPVAGCPPFGTTSVLLRSERHTHDALRGEDWSVMPGLHRPQSGEHEVVWWDPKALELDARGSFGLRQEMILSPDDHAAAEAGNEAYEAWRSAQRDAREDGGEPALDLKIVTSAEDQPPGFEELVITVEKTPRPGERPSGIRFGTLVHTILRDVDFAAPDDDVRRLAELHARLLDAPDEEVAAASAAVRSALGHPLMARAAVAARCHRETPFLVEVEAGQIVEGTIDLLFKEDGRWVVVDFKTDVDLEGLGEKYRLQLGWYLFAVQRMMRESAEGVLLSV
jgi:ATP-dependent exoDNAse (exonuclease V) beta subunit